MSRLVVILALLSLAPVGGIQAADDEGWFGLDVRVDGEGRFWNPIVSEIIINSLDEGSPAAASRIVVGDRIVKVDGITVAGKRLRKLIPYFEKGVGETLQLQLIDKNEQHYSVSLVGGQRPESAEH